jgi:hypothetical protein
VSKKSKRRAASYARQGRKPEQKVPQRPEAPETAGLAAKEIKVPEAALKQATPPPSAKKQSAGTVAVPDTYRHVIPDIKWAAITMGAMFVLLVLLTYTLK